MRTKIVSNDKIRYVYAQANNDDGWTACRKMTFYEAVKWRDRSKTEINIFAITKLILNLLQFYKIEVLPTHSITIKYNCYRIRIWFIMICNPMKRV